MQPKLVILFVFCWMICNPHGKWCNHIFNPLILQTTSNFPPLLRKPSFCFQIPLSPAASEERRVLAAVRPITLIMEAGCAAASVSCLNIKLLPFAWDAALIGFQHLDQELQGKLEFRCRNENKTWEFIPPPPIWMGFLLLVPSWSCFLELGWGLS